MALSERDAFHNCENADVKKLRAARGLYITIRKMWTGGFMALFDFVKIRPYMAVRRQKVVAYYQEHGKFNKTPVLFTDPSTTKAPEKLT